MPVLPQRQRQKKKKKSTATAPEDILDDDTTVCTPTYTAEHSYPGLGCDKLLPQMYDDSYKDQVEDMHGMDEELETQADGEAEEEAVHGAPYKTLLCVLPASPRACSA